MGLKSTMKSRKEKKAAKRIAKEDKFTTVLGLLEKKDIVFNYIASIIINVLIFCSGLFIFIYLVSKILYGDDPIRYDIFVTFVAFIWIIIFTFIAIYYSIKHRNGSKRCLGSKYLYLIDVVTSIFIILLTLIYSIWLTS